LKHRQVFSQGAWFTWSHCTWSLILLSRRQEKGTCSWDCDATGPSPQRDSVRTPNPTLGLTWSVVRRRGNGNDSRLLTAHTFTRIHTYSHTYKFGFFHTIGSTLLYFPFLLFVSFWYNVYMCKSIAEATRGRWTIIKQPPPSQS